MMSALLAAGLWLLIATKKGMPVSTTHAIVGGIVGASLTLGVILEHSEISPLSILRWNKLFEIVLSWIISPVLGGITSYMIYRVIKKYIINYNAIAQIKINRIKRKKKELKKEHKKIYETLNDLQKVAYSEILNKDLLEMQEHNLNYKHLSSDYYKKINELDMQKEKLQSHKALELGIPIIAAFGTIVLVSMLLFKGLKNLNLGLSAFQNYLIISMCATIVWAAMFVFAKNLRRSDLSKSTFLMFSWLQVLFQTLSLLLAELQLLRLQRLSLMYQ
jgi:inorganic phosphate transporter, PiT family